MPITAQLAGFVANTRAGDIPTAALSVLQLSMLDWIAVGLVGAREPVSVICRDMVVEEAGAEQAALFGSKVRVPARAAALSNGTTSHALDYDDTHFAHIGHPSVAVISAALAVAEREGASGTELQAAALIGCEVSVRVGVWLGRSHYQHGFHQTGTAGAFGAAAAAARLMKLDAAQTEDALGLVATRASGLKSQFGTMGKPFNAGIAAANGVEAATLVRAGFVPNPGGLELAQGFGPTHQGEANAAALDGLGREWLFEQVSHKFHACCHGLHATLEALATLPKVDVNEVDAILIRTHPRWMSVCNQPSPKTGLEAKFSYRMVSAMALLGHSTAALESYDDALCADPQIIALRDRVEVEASENVAETASVVTLRLSGGGEKVASFDLNTPMPLEQRRARVLGKASALLSDERAEALWELVEGQADPQKIARAIAN